MKSCASTPLCVFSDRYTFNKQNFYQINKNPE